MTFFKIHLDKIIWLRYNKIYNFESGGVSMSTVLMKEEEKHILRILPFLLKKDNQFRIELYSVLMETFATKEDLARILEEIRISREETNKRFEAMDKRFEAMDKRFEAMDKRFEAIQEQMDKRFDAMDKRFEAMQEQMDKRFEAMQEQMDKRFEAVDRRFEEQTKALNRLGMSIRTIGSRWGIETEVTIRNTLRELLLKNLKVAKIDEYKIKDKEGRIGAPNANIQIDCVIRNGKPLLIEIKSSADEAHVDRFYKIGELYAEKEGITPELLFVAVIMKEKGEIRCKQLGIQLITYDELEV